MQVVSVGSDKRLTTWEMRYSVGRPAPPAMPANEIQSSNATESFCRFAIEIIFNR